MRFADVRPGDMGMIDSGRISYIVVSAHKVDSAVQVTYIILDVDEPGYRLQISVRSASDSWFVLNEELVTRA